MDTAERMRLLAAPFPTSVVGWKAQVVKGERALCVPYIDARDVMDRLDAVVGPTNWQDTYTFHPDGTVLCRLALRLDGEWIAKEDLGGESEQPDPGDKAKAAVSDALKRAAVKWSIGRYLYRLDPVWCDYDPRTKQIREAPRLPVAAKANGHEAPTPPASAPEKTPPLPPKDGAELDARLSAYDLKVSEAGLCERGAVVEHVVTLGVKNGQSAELVRWSAGWLSWGMEQAKKFVAECKAGKGPVRGPGGSRPAAQEVPS